MDFTSNDKELGKPAFSDLASGYLTAPVFYAIEEHPSLEELISREFSCKGDLDKSLELVRGSQAIKRSRELAEKLAKESYEAINWLPDSPSQKALLDLPDYIISRLY